MSLDQVQVERAVKALLAYLTKLKGSGDGDKKSALFEDDETGRGGHSDIDIMIGLKRVPEKGANKPIRIPLPHTLYGISGREICLITKDPADDFKTDLAAKPVDGISKVIGISMLRTHYKPYNEKRKLLTAYDLFMADDRVIPLLPPLIGKKFFEKKKHPVPVTLGRKNYREDLVAARDSTYLFISSGPCCLVKAAKSTFPVSSIVANIMAAVNGSVEHIPRKWKNIQSIHIKTTSSAALPIFNSLPVASKIDLSAGAAKTAKPAKGSGNGSGSGSGSGGAMDSGDDDSSDSVDVKTVPKSKTKTSKTAKIGKSNSAASAASAAAATATAPAPKKAALQTPKQLKASKAKVATNASAPKSSAPKAAALKAAAPKAAAPKTAAPKSSAPAHKPLKPAAGAVHKSPKTKRAAAMDDE